MLTALLGACSPSVHQNANKSASFSAHENYAIIVNHAEREIGVSPERVWNEILDHYVEGNGSLESGYVNIPLNNQSASYMDGYRMVKRDDSGEIIDERRVYFSELDEDARRLSLYVEFLSEAARGMTVHASYQAVPSGSGTIYRLDAYSRQRLDPTAANKSPEEIAEIVNEQKNGFQTFLDERLAELKDELESELNGVTADQ